MVARVGRSQEKPRPSCLDIMGWFLVLDSPSHLRGFHSPGFPAFPPLFSLLHDF